MFPLFPCFSFVHIFHIGQQKEWCFWLTIVLLNSIIAQFGMYDHVCVSIVPIVLHIFHVFAVGQRHGVLLVTMIFPKGVQPQLDEWPWNCEGVLGAKGCVGTQCLGFFPTKARLNVNFKKQRKACWVKISSC